MSLGTAAPPVVQQADDVTQLRAALMELRERQTRVELLVAKLVEHERSQVMARLEFLGELARVVRDLR